MIPAVRRGSVAVVGGGITGLAVSALLARDGWSVDVLEQGPCLGGRAGVWQQDGFTFDTGPSWYLMPEVIDHFFRVLGTSAAQQLDLVRLDPGYRIFYEGRAEPVDVGAGLETNVALFDSLEPGAGEALRRYLRSARETYDLAVRRFLYTSFDGLGALLHPELARRGRRLSTLLTRSLEAHVAGHVRDPRLQQLLGYPAVFLGTSPSRAPSMYHLMSWMDLVDGVRYPLGGFSRLVAAIAGVAREHGARLHTGATVTAVDTRRDRGRPHVTGVTYREATGRSRTLHSDVVVAAADLHHVETTLLPPELQTYPESWWRRRDAGPGAVLACLGVRGQLPELQHHSLFFTRDWKRNFDAIFERPTRVPEPASIYVSKPSATDASVAPAGDEAVFVLVPVPADPAIGRGGTDRGGDPVVEKVVDSAVAQVAAWARVPDLADRVVVRRTVGPEDFATGYNSWSGGALGPGHVLRQSAFFRAGNISKRVDGLYYAGYSTIPGIGVPMCLISAELVLKRLRGDRSPGPVPVRAGEPAA